MSHLRACLLALAALMVTAIALPAHAQQKMPDGTLYTQYYVIQPPTQIHWTTCGSLPLTEGCYGSGSLGPFTNACAVVQSVPAPVNLSTVVRYIYVLDSGSTANGAVLTAYKRTDTVNSSDDTINITTVATVPLPTLVGGTGVTCMVAQNPTYIYAGTNQSMAAVGINKSSYSAGIVGLVSGTVSSITADSYGFVTIDQASDGVHGNTVYGPNGVAQSDGGGNYFMINPINSMNPASYPWPAGLPLPSAGYWPK